MSSEPFTIAGLLEGYRRRRFTPAEIIEECLSHIEAYPDPAVWIARAQPEGLRNRARMLAADPDAMARLPLYGIPFAIKDNIDCAGLPTTAACPAFSYLPQDDASVVARLLQAGAILLGKTNLDQFATGLVGTRSPHGAPRCVFDARYISGGSSSGSAVAVAAGLAAFALGTDTAGSGRVPAAFNNIVGLKPTRGLLSNHGVVPACRSLDCVSVFANSVADADTVTRIAQGFDAKDPLSRQQTPRALPISNFRFGVLAAKDRVFFGGGEGAELYEQAIGRLVGLGGMPAEIDFTPFAAAGALLYEGAWVAERLAALRGFVESRQDAMDSSVRTILAGAKSYQAADAFEAQHRLALLKREADKEWTRYDVMLLPTAPAHYTVEQIKADPLALNASLGRYTNFVNLLDCCAVAVPAGFHGSGLPFGVTLVAPAFSDGALAVMAERLHRAGHCGMGGARGAALPKDSLGEERAQEERVLLFVVGAHLSGMPLNHELQSVGAACVQKVRTAGDYRLFVLPDSEPKKPGLVRAPGTSGPGIEGEVWSLDAASFGRFVARIPPPLGIGKVELENGQFVSGFLCEGFAVAGATEITAFGGWRNYIASGP